MLVTALSTGDAILIIVFAIWYGTARIIEDFLRVDVTHGTGLTGSQWAAAATVLVAAGYLVRITRRHRVEVGDTVTEPRASSGQ